jgi:hypothetical protein
LFLNHSIYPNFPFPFEERVRVRGKELKCNNIDKCKDLRKKQADGSQHYDDQGINRDEIRTKELSKLGIKIIKFSERKINSSEET